MGETIKVRIEDESIYTVASELLGEKIREIIHARLTDYSPKDLVEVLKITDEIKDSSSFKPKKTKKAKAPQEGLQ